MLLLLVVPSPRNKMSQSGTFKMNKYILGKGRITARFTVIMVKIRITNQVIITPDTVIAVIPFPSCPGMW